MDDNIVKLFGEDQLILDLHTELHNVIAKEKYAKMYNGNVVGILEFLKWNLISGS